MNTTKNLGDPMPQAEVGGGGRIDAADHLQRPGYMIRDFALHTIRGDRVQISDYRARTNLVLFFLGSSPQDRRLLQDIAKRKQDFIGQEAVVVAILPHMPDHGERHETCSELLLTLVDAGLSVHRLFGALDQRGRPGSVIYITDRFGEIVSVHPALDGPDLPDVDDMLKTLEFINHQCPECEPPEWPR